MRMKYSPEWPQLSLFRWKVGEEDKENKALFMCA